MAGVYGRKTHKTEGILPKDPRKGYYCHRAVLSFDGQNSRPVKVQVYDGEGRLFGSYGYTSLRLNGGLTDADFDPRNKAYHFR